MRKGSARNPKLEYAPDGQHLEIQLDTTRGWRIARWWWRLTASGTIDSRQDHQFAVRVSLYPETRHVWQGTDGANEELLETADIGSSAIRLSRLGDPSQSPVPEFEVFDGAVDGIRYSMRPGQCQVSVAVFDANNALNEKLDWTDDKNRRRLMFQTDHLQTKPFPDIRERLLFGLQVEIRVIPPSMEKPRPEYDPEVSRVSAGRPGSKRRH